MAHKYVRVVQDLYEDTKTGEVCGWSDRMVRLTDEVGRESPWTMTFADDIVFFSEIRVHVKESLEW